MNYIDACVLGMLAIADLAFLVHLRRKRDRAARVERVMRSLGMAVRRDVSPRGSLRRERELAHAS